MLQHEDGPWYGPWFEVLPPYEDPDRRPRPARVGLRGGRLDPRWLRRFHPRPSAGAADWVRRRSPSRCPGRRRTLARRRGIAPRAERGVTPPTCRRILDGLMVPWLRARPMSIAFLTWRDLGHPDGGGSEVLRRVGRARARRARAPGAGPVRAPPRHRATRVRGRGGAGTTGWSPHRLSARPSGGRSPRGGAPTSSSTSSTVCRSLARWPADGGWSPSCTTCTASSGTSSTRTGAARSGGSSRAGSPRGSTADVVLTVSEAPARPRLLGVDPDLIHVAHNGLDPPARRPRGADTRSACWPGWCRTSRSTTLSASSRPGCRAIPDLRST